jgi:hypothetical protein
MSPSAKAILFVVSPADVPYGQRLVRALAARGAEAHVCVYGTGRARSHHWDPLTTRVVAVLPRPGQRAEWTDDLVRHLGGETAGFRVALLAHGEPDVPHEIASAFDVLVDTNRPDALLHDLVGYATGPWPHWLGCRVSSVAVVEPVGAAWSSRDLLVVDAAREHLVLLDRDGSVSLLLAGLTEPHHVQVDGRRLVAANAGEGVVLEATLRQGLLQGLHDVRPPGPEPEGLARPLAAARRGDLLAVADTGHDRVLVARGGRWAVLDPPGPRRPEPCALAFDDRDRLWVAYRECDEVDVFACGRVAGPSVRLPVEVAAPTALARWRDRLVVADDARRALVVVEVAEVGGVPRVGHHRTLATDQVRAPSAVAVNGSDQLAVGDRDLGCIWTVDLARALAATGP